LTALDPHLLELEALAPHQQQRDDIPEIDPPRIALPFEALEAIDQKIIIDAHPPAAFGAGDAAGPEAEGILGRAVPRLTREVLAKEFASLVEENAVELLAGQQFAPGGRTASRVRLDLVVGHSCPPSGPSRTGTDARHHPIVSTAFRQRQPAAGRPRVV